MKRLITFSITLLLTIAHLSLMSFLSPAQAAPPQRFSADTGLIVPGPHQKVRLSIIGMGNADLTVRFRQIAYTQEGCDSNGVCKLMVSSQTTSAPLTLAPGEAASLDLLATTYGRGIVISDSQNARVTVQIIDTTTGQVESVLVALLIP